MVALGASNLTRGLQALVSTAREWWGGEVEVLAALGHGRSYGAPSRVLARTLPGILESGIWAELERRPAAPTRALITDVGNDILYGSSAARILGWVEECLDRLGSHTSDMTVTDLPLFSVRRLSPLGYRFFRTLLFPRCRLTLPQTLRTGEEVVAGLETLARARGVGFFRLRPEWYGLDPIHIRPRYWRAAFREMLGGEPSRGERDRASRLEALRLYALRPEREWWLGFERVRRPVDVILGRGGRVRLF